MSAPIAVTQEPLTILTLGCGTGLEIELLLQQAPNASITGVDISWEMLIEGDAVTTVEMEAQFLDEYNRQLVGVPAAEDGHYHIDVPFSIATQVEKILTFRISPL